MKTSSSHFLGASVSPGAISGSLAGAGRSSADVGESYLLNPATVAHLRGAAITFGTTSMDVQTAPLQGSNEEARQDRLSGWRMSLNENGSDSLIASSIYWSQTRLQNRGELLGGVGVIGGVPVIDSRALGVYQLNDLWLTMGNFVMPTLTFGASVHLRESLTEMKAFQEVNYGIGFLWTPVDRFGVGLSAQNLRSPSPDLPIDLALGTTAGIGLLYLHQDHFRVRLDYTRNTHGSLFQSYEEWAFGVENFITPWLQARLGVGDRMSDASVRLRRVAFGLGFSGPRFGIHYSFQQFQMSQSGGEHSVDLLIPFW